MMNDANNYQAKLQDQVFEFLKEHSRNALRIAVWLEKEFDFIRCLLETDPTLLFEKHATYTPLHWACCGVASTDVVQVLLQADAEKRLLFSKTHYGRLPLHAATTAKNPAVIKLLLSKMIGHDFWKSEISNDVDAIDFQKEVKFIESQVESIFQKYTKKEQLAILELAVWKSRGWAENEQERAMKRITCGVDGVVESSFSFIETRSL